MVFSSRVTKLGRRADSTGSTSDGRLLEGREPGFGGSGLQGGVASPPSVLRSSESRVSSIPRFLIMRVADASWFSSQLSGLSGFLGLRAVGGRVVDFDVQLIIDLWVGENRDDAPSVKDDRMVCSASCNRVWCRRFMVSPTFLALVPRRCMLLSCPDTDVDTTLGDQVGPGCLTLHTSSCASHSALTSSVVAPPLSANCSGDTPCLSALFPSAPSRINVATVSGLECCMASMRGVSPLASTTSTSAPSDDSATSAPN
mmetsp:Transcript_4723/g.11361  ORF Transcript_4723/g.11361 Transcript_4723/m.11361 type:complete len:257 (-) Transcript_4723:8-778(-)